MPVCDWCSIDTVLPPPRYYRYDSKLGGCVLANLCEDCLSELDGAQWVE